MLQLQTGRRTASKQGQDAAGFHSLKCHGRRQKALQLQRMNHLNDRDLLRNHMRGEADITVIGSRVQMRVSRRDRCSRYAEHGGDCQDHDYYAG